MKIMVSCAIAHFSIGIAQLPGHLRKPIPATRSSQGEHLLDEQHAVKTGQIQLNTLLRAGIQRKGCIWRAQKMQSQRCHDLIPSQTSHQGLQSVEYSPRSGNHFEIRRRCLCTGLLLASLLGKASLGHSVLTCCTTGERVTSPG